jgi:hypothetical protein
MLNAQMVCDSQKEHLSGIYTFDICKAMSALDSFTIQEVLDDEGTLGALDFWPFAQLQSSIAVAIGDMKMLRNCFTQSDLLPPFCSLFPNALETSVATDKAEPLHFMLGWLKNNVGTRDGIHSWADMRKAANTVANALKVAVRLNKTCMAGILLKFLAEHHIFAQFACRRFSEDLLKMCLRFRNVELIYSAVLYLRKRVYDVADKKKLANFNFSKKEEDFVFRHMYPCAIRVLLENGMLSLERCQNGTVPLFRALQTRNLEIAEEYLANGADVDGIVSPCNNLTALYLAVESNDIKKVTLLLEYGADPNFPTNHGTPLELARLNECHECEYLLTKTIESGTEYIKRRDLWQIFLQERSQGFWSATSIEDYMDSFW